MARGRELIIIGLLGLIVTVPLPTSRAQQAKTAEKAAGFPNTPIGAVQNFIFAMATGDETALLAVTQPLPKGEVEWLLKGEHVPADQVADFHKAVAEEMKFRIGKPGEKFTLGRGRVLEIKPEEFTPDRTVILHEAAPLPTRVRRIEGRWKVDATPIIAGRKAADAVRKRNAEKAKRPTQAAP